MHTIEVDFDVFKQLTFRRATEKITYNDVIRELLGLNPATKEPQKAAPTEATGAWLVKGVKFPEGTEFQAIYGGRKYLAIVEDGALALNGRRYDSPSSAAHSITKNSVNGWTFWECRKPGEIYFELIKNVRQRAEYGEALNRASLSRSP